MATVSLQTGVKVSFDGGTMEVLSRAIFAMKAAGHEHAAKEMCTRVMHTKGSAENIAIIKEYVEEA